MPYGPNATQTALEITQNYLRDAIENGVERERLLKDDLIKKHGENADSPGFRQFEAEYNVRFPAVLLDASRELLNALQSADAYYSAPLSTLTVSSRMLVTGPSGIGKTHAIVDYALMRRGKERPSLILFGEDFGVDESWVTVAVKLGFGTAINKTQLFSMLDAAAELPTLF